VVRSLRQTPAAYSRPGRELFAPRLARLLRKNNGVPRIQPGNGTGEMTAIVCKKCGCCPAYRRGNEQWEWCLWCEENLPCPGAQAKARAKRLADSGMKLRVVSTGAIAADSVRIVFASKSRKKEAPADARRRLELLNRGALKETPAKWERAHCKCGRKLTARSIGGLCAPCRAKADRRPRRKKEWQCRVCRSSKRDLPHARLCAGCRQRSRETQARPSAPRNPVRMDCLRCHESFTGSAKRRYCDRCIQLAQASGRAGRPNPRKKYFFTSEQDERIRQVYIERLKRKFSAKATLASEFAMPVHAISKRAVELGVARVKERPWSQTELELLGRHAWKTNLIIARILKSAGYSRTPTAVNVMLKRRGFLKRGSRPFYSSRQLGDLLGIDAHAVIRWIEQGWLAARHVPTERTHNQHGDPWAIFPCDVYQFVRDHPTDFDLRKVDQLWFLQLLLDEKTRPRPNQGDLSVLAAKAA
jgi:hypothetical protein